MARKYASVGGYTYVDIEISEFMEQINENQVDLVLDCIDEEDIIDYLNRVSTVTPRFYGDMLFEEMLEKIKNNRYLLNEEEETLLLQISSRF
jgi:pentose-5-phosphate-3-epimerase